MPLPNPASLVAESCPACRNERFRFTGVQAVGLYDGVLRDAVLRMKKAHEEVLTLTLGRLLAEKVRFSDPIRPELIVPVPMHWTRRITRGTNPPEILAEMMAKKLGIPAATDLLCCRRKTRKQGTLLPDQRRRNVRAAFSVSAGYDIKDTCVLLVDDVMTTGATANELSKVLRWAGAKQVSVAVVARGTG
jgi:ComF family protein